LLEIRDGAVKAKDKPLGTEEIISEPGIPEDKVRYLLHVMFVTVGVLLFLLEKWDLN